jgi:hypothetical protein
MRHVLIALMQSGGRYMPAVRYRWFRPGSLFLMNLIFARLKSCPVGVEKELHNVRPPALHAIACNLRMLIKKGTKCVIARGLGNIFSFH